MATQQQNSTGYALQDLDDRLADRAEANWLQAGGSVERFLQDDGFWTVAVFYFQQPDGVARAGVIDNINTVTEEPSMAVQREIGTLSREYESNGNPGAIGRDSTGGYSYGEYQIATKTGTMKAFLDFLRKQNADGFHVLTTAGGFDAALSGAPDFRKAWKQLAVKPDFVETQRLFIQVTHFEPFVVRTKARLGLDLMARSVALQNVAWSVAVQHGPGNVIFEKALRNVPLTSNDSMLINAIYDERSKVNNYFNRSTEEVKVAVLSRFAHERADALAMA